jgi:secernin
VCDCLVALPAASESARTLFAKNSDRPADEAQELEWLVPRRDPGPVRTTYMEVDPAPGETLGVLASRPAWMWGLEHGVNEAGVAVGNEAVFTTLNPRRFPPRLVGMDLVRLALERADTAGGAVGVIVDLLDRYGQGGSGYEGRDDPYWSSFLVADPADAWIVETSGTQTATEHVTRTAAISNRLTIPAFDAAHRDPATPTGFADPRLRSSRALLATAPVTVARVREHLRDHTVGDDGFTVCMHVDDQVATTAALIAELPGPFPSRRPLAHVCLGSPCRSIFVPVAVGRPLGHPPAWKQFRRLSDETRRQLADLEADLAAAPGSDLDSDEWAPNAWRRVETVLDADRSTDSPHRVAPGGP